MLFKKKQQRLPKKFNKDQLEEDFKNAQLVVNEVFYPSLKKNIDQLNLFLEEKHGVRVGVEINWFFEKVDE